MALLNSITSQMMSFRKIRNTRYRDVLLPVILVTLILGCQTRASENPSSNPDNLATGKEIYTQYCVLCHGADGRLQLNGAKDITASELTLGERIALIKNGRNTMTPFEGILSNAEMQAVARYTMTIE